MLSAARVGAVLASAVLLVGMAASPAPADDVSPAASPSPVAIPAGLYGKDDPTYDGVWRQSLALLALRTAQVTPAKEAVDWLTRQQCANGGWPSFRADTVNACTAATEDSNATSVAVQALVALGGHPTAVAKGVSWIKRNQNPDGGWSYNPGGTSDADSTGLSISALTAAKAQPSQVRRNGRDAYDGLAAFQLGCDAPADQRGAFSSQPDKSGALVADDLASAQATLAAAGGALPVTTTIRRDRPAAAPSCAKGSPAGAAPHQGAAESASYYIIQRLAAGKQRLMQSLPGSAPAPDYTATSWAVLSLVAAGHPDQASDAADWLAGNAYGWTQGEQGVNPSATATLLLVARAVGLDPYNFGGTNLVQLLINAGPAPAARPPAAVTAASASPNSTLAPGSSVTGTDDGENGGFSPVWLIAMGVLAGAGAGLFLKFGRAGRRPRTAVVRTPATAHHGPEGGGPAGGGTRPGGSG